MKVTGNSEGGKRDFRVRSMCHSTNWFRRGAEGHVRERAAMRTIIGWLCALLCSAAGWWLGQFAGLWAAVILSAVAGGLGLYWGNRWFDENLR